MSLTLYTAPPSGHCHRVRLCAALLDISLTEIDVASFKDGRSGAAFRELNPLGQVPVLRDGDFILRDSLAILKYLCTRYAKESAWLPRDPREEAEVDQWFGLAAGFIFLGPNRARLIQRFKSPLSMTEAKAAAARAFDAMELHLSRNDWLVGRAPSLADIACYSYVALAPEGGLSLDAYPGITRWLDAMRRLPGFVEAPFAERV